MTIIFFVSSHSFFGLTRMIMTIRSRASYFPGNQPPTGNWESIPGIQEISSPFILEQRQCYFSRVKGTIHATILKLGSHIWDNFQFHALRDNRLPPTMWVPHIRGCRWNTFLVSMNDVEFLAAHRRKWFWDKCAIEWVRRVYIHKIYKLPLTKIYSIKYCRLICGGLNTRYERFILENISYRWRMCPNRHIMYLRATSP